MELEAKHYDAIMDCLDEFDFERVHKVMTFLDWTWSDGGVPDILALRRNCRKYLQEVVRGALEHNGFYITATGGFRYESKLYEDGFLWLRMSFTIEDWDNAE